MFEAHTTTLIDFDNKVQLSVLCVDLDALQNVPKLKIDILNDITLLISQQPLLANVTYIENEI